MANRHKAPHRKLTIHESQDRSRNDARPLLLSSHNLPLSRSFLPNANGQGQPANTEASSIIDGGDTKLLEEAANRGSSVWPLTQDAASLLVSHTGGNFSNDPVPSAPVLLEDYEGTQPSEQEAKIRKDLILPNVEAAAEILSSGRPFDLYKEHLRRFLHPLPTPTNLQDEIQSDATQAISAMPKKLPLDVGTTADAFSEDLSEDDEVLDKTVLSLLWRWFIGFYSPPLPEYQRLWYTCVSPLLPLLHHNYSRG